jgi:hypothetical protein
LSMVPHVQIDYAESHTARVIARSRAHEPAASPELGISLSCVLCITEFR